MSSSSSASLTTTIDLFCTRLCALSAGWGGVSKPLPSSGRVARDCVLHFNSYYCWSTILLFLALEYIFSLLCILFGAVIFLSALICGLKVQSLSSLWCFNYSFFSFFLNEFLIKRITVGPWLHHFHWFLVESWLESAFLKFFHLRSNVICSECFYWFLANFSILWMPCKLLVLEPLAELIAGLNVQVAISILCFYSAKNCNFFFESMWVLLR